MMGIVDGVVKEWTRGKMCGFFLLGWDEVVCGVVGYVLIGCILCI